MKTVLSPQELALILTPKSRLLGLDLGTKTIGLAVASWDIGLATPVTTLRRTKFRADAAELMAFIAHEEITALVLGLPLNMDGSEGSRAQSTRTFVRNLQSFAPPPVMLWDERLTSNEAEDQMLKAGLSRGKRAEVIDAMAAALILQGALDALETIVRAANIDFDDTSK